MEKVNRWREALTQAANLSGWGLDNETKGYEAKFIKKVVKDVACKLGNKTLPVAKHLSAGQSSGGLVGNTNEIKGDALPTRKLVGQAFEDNKKFIWSLLMGDEVSSIGIYGMAGVGKTALVTHLYNQLLERPESPHVYWITASQDTSINRLQTSLARHIGLDLSNEDDEMHREVLLKKELMKQRHKWVLILDDLWKAFDLQKLGIPDQADGYKLILTTRSKKICQQMKTQHAIKLQPILEEEAWTLFIERLGHDITLSLEVEQIAVDIVRECAGLPLGIITMAGSLRGVDDEDEWRNTLKILKESKYRDMEDEVFRMLRFSYDRLDDVALQQCLLYCALFPEDYIIEREELIDYLIDEGIIQKKWSREAAFDKGHAMLDRLENAGLLQRIDGDRAVKMHDLVRDMAVRICKENPSVKIKDMAIRICKVNHYVKEQRRMGIEMAVSNIDPFWNHVEQTNDGIMKCVFCGHLFAKNTSISRIKVHLARERGRGVRICGQVPKQVQEAAFLYSTHKAMRRKRIEMAPFKSGWTGAVSASAREQNNVDMAQQRESLFLALDSVHHVDRIVPPTIDENYNRREATERLVQIGVGASSFGVYGNHNAISTSQQENVAGDEGTTPAAATRDHTPGRYFEEFSRWLMEDGEDEELLEQRRKGIEMAVSNIKSFWNHVELTNDGILKCVFCGHLFPKDTSILRIKFHLAGERGRGVRICGQVPKQVQEAAFLSMHGGNSCSPEELPHDTFQTIPITEPVVQVLGQSNVELDNFSVGAERTQVEEEEEEDMLNNSGRVAQPGAGASSSGGLRHNPSETRGAPLLTGSTKLVGRAFEENRNVILSWLKDDKVSIIGIYGMAGAGKTTLLEHICNELLRSPDIYYPVYWVTLSPDFSIHKLQNKIAKCIQLSFSNEEKELGLRAEKLSQKLMKKQRCWKEEELGRRAKELSQELMKKQRWILILDNLCNSFELNKVGIPVPFKRCKLIMITRSEEVCLQMNSKYNVRVNPLPREESWTLWYLQGGFLCCQGQGRKMIASGWTLLMTNLILEIASAGFDQLGYALVGMVLAFVALVLAAADLIHMPRKERTSLLPSFHRQSASTFVGTIVEYFGLVGGVWQCFYSTVEYAYAHQKRDNPIKMCLLPFLFLSCVVISILIKKSYIDKRA